MVHYAHQKINCDLEIPLQTSPGYALYIASYTCNQTSLLFMCDPVLNDPQTVPVQGPGVGDRWFRGLAEPFYHSPNTNPMSLEPTFFTNAWI